MNPAPQVTIIVFLDIRNFFGKLFASLFLWILKFFRHHYMVPIFICEEYRSVSEIFEKFQIVWRQRRSFWNLENWTANRSYYEARKSRFLVLLISKVHTSTELELEEFFYKDSHHNTKWTTISLPLRKSIGIIVDIHRNFFEWKSMETNLIDELTRILHTIHRDMNLIEYLYSHHTISVVGIRQMNPRDKRCKYFPSP